MKIVSIKAKKQENGFLVSCKIEFGINTIYANNLYKDEKDAKKLKVFLQTHKEDWFKFYYLIPRSYLITKELEGKVYQVSGINFSLYIPKKEEDEIDF